MGNAKLTPFKNAIILQNIKKVIYMILVILKPEGKRKVIALEQFPVSMGRDKANSICLDSEKNLISRNHCQLCKQGEDVIIKDNNSKNGTFVNNQEVTEKLLNNGDRIGIGEYILVFKNKVLNDIYLQDTDSNENKDLIHYKPITTSFLKTNNIKTTELSLSFGESLVMGGIQHTITDMQKTNQDEVYQLLFQKLSLINEFSKALIALNNLEPFYEEFCSILLKTFNADRSVIFIYEDQNLYPVFLKMTNTILKPNLGLSQTVLSNVVQRKSSVLINKERDYTKSMQEMGIISAVCVPMLNAKIEVKGVVYLDKITGNKTFADSDAELLIGLANLFTLGYERIVINENLQKELELKIKLSRYHSPDVIDKINKKEVSYFIEEKKATILFADIVGFTTLSENRSPREVVALLNEYFNAVTDIIFEYKGSLDKYIGDAIMAVFGAPLSTGKDEYHAVMAGLKMMENLKKLHVCKKEKDCFKIRVGINTGNVITGDIGSLKRMDYTVIGDAVNLASRLEAYVAGPMEIVIGEETYKKVQEYFNIEYIGEVQVKGKEKNVKAYKVLGIK